MAKARKKKKSRIAQARARQRRYRKFVGRSRISRKEIDVIDYKDTSMLQKFLSQQGKLYSRKRTGLDAQRQRELKLAVKYARYLGLLPYVG
jgi:small subunit ribosomal protein S18